MSLLRGLIARGVGVICMVQVRRSGSTKLSSALILTLDAAKIFFAGE